MEHRSETAVRRAGLDDAVTVARLLTDFNTEFDSRVPAMDELSRRFGQLLARADVQVHLAERPAGAGTAYQPVGFALVTLRPTPYSDGPLAQLEELYVQPAVRSHGIGATLLSEAIAAATSTGVEELHIGVDEEDHDARRFYERAGFTNVEPDSGSRMLLYLREL